MAEWQCASEWERGNRKMGRGKKRYINQSIRRQFDFDVRTWIIHSSTESQDRGNGQSSMNG
jgi:hypothetical protein